MLLSVYSSGCVLVECVPVSSLVEYIVNQFGRQLLCVCSLQPVCM